jgi:hypothetical protein
MASLLLDKRALAAGIYKHNQIPNKMQTKF